MRPANPIEGRERGDERKLAQLFRSLNPEDRKTLLAFAAFLASRAAADEPGAEEPLEPEPIPRPSEESVIAAIKRLSRSYFMLDHSKMLNETSALMGAHVLQGRPAEEVIDSLEALFAGEYEKYRDQT